MRVSRATGQEDACDRRPASSPTKSSLSALLAGSPRETPQQGSSTLGKKRLLSAQSSPPAIPSSSTPSGSLGYGGGLGLSGGFPSTGNLSSAGGPASSALTSSLTGGLSAALQAQSLPHLSIPNDGASGSGTPLSPLSSTTPLSCTPSTAVPMPRRKFPKQDDVAASLESEDDEFDSAAIGLSVRDPAFMPPHLLLSMSLPNNGPDFGRGGFRPGSVMEGRGRKLCGMDAFRVRNDILRQTGFLEPLDKSVAAAGDIGDA